MSYKNFKVSKSSILPEVLIIEPSMNWDLRGSIYTSFMAQQYQSLVSQELSFNHDKFAESSRNVLRGLHGDTKTWKLVSCVFGRIYQVVVDMRIDSLTYQKWDAFELNSDSYKQILIPPGFVNGYYVQSEKAVFHYKLAYDGNYIDANEQITISWNDGDLGIEWPCKDPILQIRDNI